MTSQDPRAVALFLCSQLSGKASGDSLPGPTLFWNPGPETPLSESSAERRCDVGWPLGSESETHCEVPKGVIKRRERRLRPRERQAPSGDFRNPAVHHEVPV